jgi:hypothetical protein
MQWRTLVKPQISLLFCLQGLPGIPGNVGSDSAVGDPVSFHFVNFYMVYKK